MESREFQLHLAHLSVMDPYTATPLPGFSLKDRDRTTCDHDRQWKAAESEVIYTTASSRSSNHPTHLPLRHRTQPLPWPPNATVWDDRPAEIQVLYSTSVRSPLARYVGRPSIDLDEYVHRKLPRYGLGVGRAVSFNLAKRIQGKEGVPISFLLNETLGALVNVVEHPYKRIPALLLESRTCFITLRLRACRKSIT
ncbi:hypothetical protein BD311DRAFT_274663 [Dichomitus squalens]|uniref:Uncharacterized protein n=1 Tax=Dichomitus squalens TaxID=114155 RepID=A0A4V2K0J9_9APHY|nr:hypothetical protein BD311DRAFT_274663 [Dichomitus squalens]